MFQVGARAVLLSGAAVVIASSELRRRLNRYRCWYGTDASRQVPPPPRSEPKIGRPTAELPAGRPDPSTATTTSGRTRDPSRRRPCKIGVAISLLPGYAASQVRLLVADHGLPLRDAAKLLGHFGVHVGYMTVYRHRNLTRGAGELERCGCRLVVETRSA